MKKVLFMLLFAFAGLLAGTGVYLWNQFGQPSRNADTVVVAIPQGSGPLVVGKILKEQGIWESPRLFQWYVRFLGKGGSLKAGHFEIPAHISLSEVLEILSGHKEAARRITIPEGRASWEIFTILQNHYPQLDRAVWDSLIHNESFTRSLSVDATNLEGWLYPDTYRFPLGADEKELITFLVRSMQKCLISIDNGAGTQFGYLGGWQQTLTLASIVEEETGKGSERARVSGVFHNRLHMGMPLGADPTVRFIFRNLTGPIYKSQLASENPYNTRRFPGLPPGPISNPGRKAIEAALNPVPSKDLYFVAKDDGSGEHFFAPTLAKHNEYKNTAAQNRGE